jgi:hypothetical protein
MHVSLLLLQLLLPVRTCLEAVSCGQDVLK